MAKSWKKQYTIDRIKSAEARLIWQRDLLNEQMRKTLAIEDHLTALKTELRKIETEEAFLYIQELAKKTEVSA